MTRVPRRPTDVPSPGSPDVTSVVNHSGRFTWSMKTGRSLDGDVGLLGGRRGTYLHRRVYFPPFGGDTDGQEVGTDFGFQKIRCFVEGKGRGGKDPYYPVSS